MMRRAGRGIRHQLLLTTLICCSVNAQAREWWVAPGRGRDFSAGTAAQPFATILHAVYVTQPGDTIVLRGAYYDVTQRTSSYIWKSGTPNAWITVRAAPGEVPVLKSIDGTPCIGTNKDYVEIRGITCTGQTGIRADGRHLRIIGNRVQDITGPNGAGIAGGGTDDVTIEGNIVERVRHSGIWMGSNRRGGINNIRIVGNTVRSSGRAWQGSASAAGGWPAGLAIVGAQNGLIERNVVERTFGEGIACSLSDQCKVLRNIVWDAFNTLYHGDNVTNSVWEGNVGWTTGDSNFARNYGQGQVYAGGVLLGNERGWFSGAGNPTSGNVVCNNVFSNVWHGVNFANYFDGDRSGIGNTVVANNTFYNTKKCGIHVSEGLPLYNNRFANNVVVPAYGTAPTCILSTGIRYDHNLWASGDPGIATGVGDVRAQPQFSSRGTTPYQYALRAGSPGIDAGAVIGIVPNDLSQRPRFKGASYDMGAFEVR